MEERDEGGRVARLGRIVICSQVLSGVWIDVELW